jgi:hypothetical protein
MESPASHGSKLGSFGRREFLALGAGAAVGCGRQKSTGFNGYAFVANEVGQAVAAVDLSSFTVARHIRLNSPPGDIIAHKTSPLVYVLTPQTGTLHEIEAEKLAVRRTLHVAPAANSMQLAADGRLWVLSGASRKLVNVDLDAFRIDSHVPLPGAANDFDIAARLGHALVTYGDEGSVSWIDLAQKKASAPQKLAPRLGAVRFLSNGESIVAANVADRVLTAVRVDNRQVITHLPLAVRPDHLCFNRDGGQLYITGAGQDAVVVVYPYFVPQVAETMLAGHAPAAMAATDNYLFVANPQAGDVTILNIARETKRKVISVVSVGSEPSYITFTTDDKYALVLNQRSGDMAVISSLAIAKDRATRRKSAALFTIIPVGSKPVSAAVKAVG